MKILSIYNTPIKLEEGDLIAIEKDRNKLWIRSGNHLYTCEKANELDLEGRIYVNSAGFHSRDRDITPKMNWVKYKSRNYLVNLWK